MKTPVFFIHGIGNRDESAFVMAVEKLAVRIGGIEAHPLYWGDLGAKYDYITETLPRRAGDLNEVRDGYAPPSLETLAIADFLGGRSSTDNEIRSGSYAPEAVISAATRASGSMFEVSEEIRGQDPSGWVASEIRVAIERYWSDTTWLKTVGDQGLLEAIGEAVGGPMVEVDDERSEVRGSETRGVTVIGLIRQRLMDVDRIVGATIGMAAGRLNSHLRTKLMPSVTRAAGDVLVYQRHREEIAQRVRTLVADVNPNLGTSAENPIDVVAHSLGGVITFDLATSRTPLWVRQFVTCGSQASFFHVCDPRGGLIDPFAGAGTAVRLPPSIGHWTNLWEPLDPLAFAAATIFRLHDKSVPKDVEVPHLASSGVWTHSDYWNLEIVVNGIRASLAE